MRMRTQSAINMIRGHGFHASVTADGLIANMPATWDSPLNPAWPHCYDAGGMSADDVRFTDDIMFEETTVFDVREDGTVDSDAIRAFLGY